MIAEAELRRLAAVWKVDPMIVDLDYVLGCFLSQWCGISAAKTMRFKGGTCLRKAYFGGYRFSEDLDFTSEKHMTIDELRKLLERTIEQTQSIVGLNLSERPPKVENLSDDYGRESYHVRLYYRGPLRWRGDPRAIRLDISQTEHLGLPAAARDIIHPYSDKELVAGLKVPCYSLEEMLSEKLRALSGQRRYAIARDLYDVFQLVKRGNINFSDVTTILPLKFQVKGIAIEKFNRVDLEGRRDEFESDWVRNLSYLLPAAEEVHFEKAWELLLSLISEINEST